MNQAPWEAWLVVLGVLCFVLVLGINYHIEQNKPVERIQVPPILEQSKEWARRD